MTTVSRKLQVLKKNGWVLCPSILDINFCKKLGFDLEKAYAVCRKIQKKKGLDDSTVGAAHHILPLGQSFLELLDRKPLFDLIDAFLEGPSVLNSFGGIVSRRGEKIYSHSIHRDIRTSTKGFPLQISLLILLDDFTNENGGTYFLSGSAHSCRKPSEQFFYQRAKRLNAPRGSIAVFNSGLWHAGGVNQTDLPRRALTLTFSRPFVKPQYDYLSAFEPRIEILSENLRQLLGYHSRVPKSLNEWYCPPEKRFYRSDQG